MSTTAKCKECGNDLGYDCTISHVYGEIEIHIEIEPCSTCIEIEGQASYDCGWTDGRNDFTEEDIRNAMEEALTKRSLR